MKMLNESWKSMQPELGSKGHEGLDEIVGIVKKEEEGEQ